MPRKSTAYLLRPMTIDDHPQVTALWTRCEGIGEPETREEIGLFIARNPGLSPVATFGEAEEVVAALLCGHDGRRGYLYHVAVDSAHRKKGLARLMINDCLSKLRDLAIRRCSIHIYANNDAGELFWLHNKWRRRTDLKVMAIDL